MIEKNNQWKKNDLHISGVSAMPGGEYDAVSISGAGKIQGSLLCSSLRCSGSGKVYGDVHCSGEMAVSGAVDVEGSVWSEELRCSGVCRLTGDLEVHRLWTFGSLKIGGKLSGEDLQVSGTLQGSALHCREIAASGKLRLTHGLEAEKVRISGIAEVDGLLNAEIVEIQPTRFSHLTDVGGSEIRILDMDRSVGLCVSGCLSAQSIEGDTIELEYVKADVVRGKHIRIGKGCKIGRVEYSGSLEAVPGTVEEEVCSGPADNEKA